MASKNEPRFNKAAVMDTALTCGHSTKLFPVPSTGDLVWCGKCWVYRPVQYTWEAWRYTCKGCKAGRVYGSVRKTAERNAQKHADTMAHTVEIYRGTVLMATIVNQGTMLAPESYWRRPAGSPKTNETIKSMSQVTRVEEDENDSAPF